MSLMLQLITIVSTQIGGLMYTKSQDWFIPFNVSNPSYNGTLAESFFKNTTIEIDTDEVCMSINNTSFVCDILIANCNGMTI